MPSLESWFTKTTASLLPNPLAKRFDMRQRRRSLAIAALRCVAHGWPVLPGAWWSAEHQRYICDIPGCLTAGLHPAAAEVPRTSHPTNLGKYALTTRRGVIDTWRRRAYTILIPTGIGCDVVELPREYIHTTLADTHVDRCGAPTAVFDDSVYLFAAPSRQLETVPDLAHSRFVIHKAGSWVPIPPALTPDSQASWLRNPSKVGWRLPETATLLAEINRAQIA
ncbi:MAG: hypothetical protein HOQ05_13015 [Corynebacteriales bacterium]|nr:hypothetical protein [Mycobacteriales bacterium]